MVKFVSKPIITSQTIGERFIKTRQGSGLSLLNVAQEIGIKERYLAAIEAGQYGDLPGDIYALEFVKTYARFLHLNEREAAGEYIAERQVVVAAQLRGQRFANIKQIGKWLGGQYLFFGKLGVAIFIFGFMAYVLSLARVYNAGPKLEIFSPTAYYESTTSLVVLAGQTNPHANIFINNEEVIVDEQGSFNEAINVLPGVTLIKIVAQDEHGRRQTVYRTIRSLEGQVAGVSVVRGEE